MTEATVRVDTHAIAAMLIGAAIAGSREAVWLRSDSKVGQRINPHISANPGAAQ